jgi:hypothetical protein
MCVMSKLDVVIFKGKNPVLLSTKMFSNPIVTFRHRYKFCYFCGLFSRTNYIKGFHKKKCPSFDQSSNEDFVKYKYLSQSRLSLMLKPYFEVSSKDQSLKSINKESIDKSKSTKPFKQARLFG